MQNHIKTGPQKEGSSGKFVITASSFVTNIPVLSSMATASKRNYEKLTTKNIA